MEELKLSAPPVELLRLLVEIGVIPPVVISFSDKLGNPSKRLCSLIRQKNVGIFGCKTFLIAQYILDVSWRDAQWDT